MLESEGITLANKVEKVATLTGIRFILYLPRLSSLVISRKLLESAIKSIFL